MSNIRNAFSDVATTNRRVGTRKPESIRRISRDLPPVVYYVRTRDGHIKIGHTVNLGRRLSELGLGWEHVLVVTPGTRDDETAMHDRFRRWHAYKVDYFHASAVLVAHINDLRAAMNLSPILTTTPGKPKAVKVDTSNTPQLF